MSDDNSAPNGRTPLTIIIKTIATHFFALASYAYTTNLLRRPTRAPILALRVLFFLFVPTLPLVELLFSVSRALLDFLRNYEEDDSMHIRFYLSAAVGMHASLSQDDDNKEGAADRSNNLHLLTVGTHCAEKKVAPLDWIWVGKFLAAIFSVVQAVGTIVMWVRRMTIARETFGFDHRNGAMGIASTICGSICIIVLLLRLNWKVSKSFEVTRGGEKGVFGSQQRQFAVEALLAMLLHLGIAEAASRRNRWLYTSVGSVAFLITLNGSVLLHSWQSLLLVVFLIVFRQEVSARLGPYVERCRRWLGAKRWSRGKALLGFLLAVWVLVDLVRVFVLDVLRLVHEAPWQTDADGFWWQDPLSDSLVVI